VKPTIVAMTKSVNKIKEVVKLNKPKFNEKYKVWVVRMKTKSGWKAVWRKQKDDALLIYDLLLKKVIKEVIKPSVIPSNSLDDWNAEMEGEEKTTSKPLAGNVLKSLFTKSSVNKEDFKDA
jgi:hypothetical protein